MAKLIYFDAGHGGSDPGAVKYEKESELTIKVVKYACAYLKANYDVEVYQDISADSLNTITARANKKKAALFVSVHFNAGKGDGYEALVYSSANKKLGQHFEKYVKAVGQNSRGVKYRPDLAVLRDTNMKSILNEIAFVDNWDDIQDWNDNAELKKMGEALAKAAASWVGAKTKVKKKITIESKGISSTGKPKITWKKVNGAKKYEAYRADYKDSTYSKMFSTTNCSYTNTNAKVGYIYYYKIKAINSKGSVIAESDIVSIKCTEGEPVIVDCKDFKVRTVVNNLNIRKTPEIKDNIVGHIKEKGTYTIIKTTEDKTWGYLKSGTGWIRITSNYVKKV